MAQVEFPSAAIGQTMTFALPSLVFTQIYHWSTFGVIGGMEPLYLVEPVFTLLGPFYQTNPINQLSTRLDLLLQVHV